MSTLFLDIDGVLNSCDSDGRFGKNGYSKFKELFNFTEDDETRILMTHLVNINIERCVTLQILLKIYNVNNIVICSSWKKVFSLDYIKIFFIAKGFPDIADLITDQTQNLNSEGIFIDRDNEILEYIKTNKIKDYYILDDEVFNIEIFEKNRLLFVAFENLYENYVSTILKSIKADLTSDRKFIIRDVLNRVIKNSNRYETILTKFKET